MVTLRPLNNIHAEVQCSDEQRMELYQFFAYSAPNFQFHPKFRARLWDGKVHLFNYSDNSLPIGLTYLLKAFAAQYQYDLDTTEADKLFVDNNVTAEHVSQFAQMMLRDCSIDGVPLVVRDYQLTALQACLQQKRGVVLYPTGSGKSLIMYLLTRFRLQQKDNIIVIVPNKSLVEQLYHDFQSYGWDNLEQDCCMCYSGLPRRTTSVLISTWQSMYKQPSAFFNRFGTVIIDECHSVARSTSIAEFCKKCTKATHRYGFTGTLPTEILDQVTVHSHIGPVIQTTTSKELIDRGVLSQLVIANVVLKYPDAIVEQMKKRPYPEEERFIMSYEPRLDVLQYIVNNVSSSENMLVLCQKRAHLNSIYEYLRKHYPKRHVYKIDGLIPAKVREEIRQLTDKQQGVIVVGTFATMSTGINIRRLHNVVFASSYKSKIKVLQSIGRGLRTHASKSKLILWDIIDDLSWTSQRGTLKKNYLLHHFEQRLQYYHEQGFRVVNRILSLPLIPNVVSKAK